MANAKKQPYPVTVADTKGNLVPPGVPVAIDQESSDSILKTFGPFKGAEAPSENPVKSVAVDLDDPLVKKAIEAEAKALPIDFTDPSVVQAIADAVAEAGADLESDAIKKTIAKAVKKQTADLTGQLEKLTEAAGAFVLEMAAQPVDPGKAATAEAELKTLLGLNE